MVSDIGSDLDVLSGGMRPKIGSRNVAVIGLQTDAVLINCE